MDAAALTASQALSAMAHGALTATDLIESCLARIAACDPDIRAFVHVDARGARDEARRADERRAAGISPGLLAGIPVAIKDILDVRGMPTGFGAAYREPRIAARDSAVVAQLRRQGAILLGKTVTVAFAAAGPVPPTRNPRDLARSPGGSSSGSAAAVAAGMVPLAIGTQTGGSQIRPAAFTGTHAFKPSYGSLDRTGMSAFAPSLDTIGWGARSVADLRLLAAALLPRELLSAPPPAGARMTIGIARGPHWAEASPAMQQALHQAEGRLRDAGIATPVINLPDAFDELTRWQEILMFGEGYRALRGEYARHGDRLPEALAAIATNARGIGEAELQEAGAFIGNCRPIFDGLFRGGLDAILTPAAAGEAPAWAEGTGSSRFNKMWSALHAPCVALPAGTGPLGLPLGLQLVGPRRGDGALLACAERVDRILRATPT